MVESLCENMTRTREGGKEGGQERKNKMDGDRSKMGLARNSKQSKQARPGRQASRQASASASLGLGLGLN
jgi:hypothetical protein